MSQSPIEQLLVAARRRFLFQTITAQASLALSAAMAALSILLIAGTQILDWYWPVLVFAGALGVGIWRTRNRRPEPYSVLQRVDARADLHDSISTAYYYRHIAPKGRGDAGILAVQANRAEELARRVDVEHAVPFKLPAAAYAAIFTAVIAATLFGIRYGVHRSLDLSPPVSEALMDFFRPSTEMEKAWEQAEARAAGQLAKDRVPTERQDEFDDASRLTAVEAHEAKGDDLAPNSNRMPNDSALEKLQEGQSPGDNPFDGDSLPPPNGAEPANKGEQSSEPPFPQEDSDLLRKMQDAFANLMNKLNVPPKAGKTKRFPSEESKGGESQEQAQQGEEPAEGDQQGDGSPSPSAEGEQTQQAKAGEGQGEAKEGGEPGEQSSQSSAGQQDGLKEIKAAQQLEAMGKLEEILGERAENIKGEIMVEVSSGPQRLQTEYSNTKAAHRSAGTEIHRDEVPLELQPYIQRYFEEIRKADRTATAPPAGEL